MTMETIIILACLGIGLLFNLIGIIGLLRFPDVYTRLHAETKTTTFGTIFTSLSVVVYAAFHYFQTQPHDPDSLNLAVHALIAIILLAFTNANGSHAIARAAYRRGQKPAPAVVDQLESLDVENEGDTKQW